MNNAIRLTNRTAINLRKSAVRVKNTFFAIAVLVSIFMAVIAVLLGLKWLIAVPVIVVAAVAIDALIVIFGRSIYLSMLAQAICTEAAAREIRAGTSESQRREKAITDLISAKADVEAAQLENRKKPAAAQRKADKTDEGADEDDVRTDDVRKTKSVKEEKADETETAAPRRRRRSDGLRIIRSEQVK